MRYLLDKNIIRYAVSAFVYGYHRQLNPFETQSITFIQQSQKEDSELFISPASANILRRISYPEAQWFINYTTTLVPSKYFTRWARRVRDTSGLTRDDAAMIALATFGTVPAGTILGVNALVTFDQAMMNAFNTHQVTLVTRLQRMARQLQAPYRYAKLPDVLSPEALQKASE